MGEITAKITWALILSATSGYIVLADITAIQMELYTVIILRSVVTIFLLVKIYKIIRERNSNNNDKSGS